MTTAHWAAAYIGTPWIARRHDCWAFARRVWAALANGSGKAKGDHLAIQSVWYLN